MEKEKISKGEKGTDCDTDLEMKMKGDIIYLTKGFLGLMLNKKQAVDLLNWLNDVL